MGGAPPEKKPREKKKTAFERVWGFQNPARFICGPPPKHGALFGRPFFFSKKVKGPFFRGGGSNFTV